MDFLYTSGPSGEGESSMNSSSISISVLLRRELPRIPLPHSSAETPSPDQTYSNLVFSATQRPAPETLYEPVVAKQGAPQLVANLASSTEAAPLGSEGRVVTADYACVRKVKKPQPELCEVMPGESSQKPSDGLPGWGGAACSPPTAKVRQHPSLLPGCPRPGQWEPQPLGGGCSYCLEWMPGAGLAGEGFACEGGDPVPQLPQGSG